MLDLTKPDNKKFIPVGTFLLGVFVGGLIMHLYCAKKSKEKKPETFGSGGTIIVQAPPAQIPAAAPAPVAAAPIVSADSMAQNNIPQ